MTNALFRVCLLLFVFGCTSKGSETAEPSSSDKTSLPDHIKNLENLIIIPTNVTPLKTIRFEEGHSYGEIYPALTPPSRGFGVENAIDADGNVFRVDKSQSNIQVFDALGNQRGVIGRAGQGPGEFLDITTIFIQGSKLVVYDSNLLRVSIFDKNSLELIESFNFDPHGLGVADEVKFPHPRTLLDLNGNLFLSAFLMNDKDGRSYEGYYPMDKKGKIASKRLVEVQYLKMHTGTLENGSPGSARLPFSTKGLIDVAYDGTIYHANTGEFLINILNSKGELQNAIYHPFKKAAFDKKEFEGKLSPYLKSLYKNVEYPGTWPALDGLFIDDEKRLWVSTIVDDQSIREWWVLNESGELLSQFNWPSKDEIVDIRDGKLYMEHKGETPSDAKTVVSYDIILSLR